MTRKRQLRFDWRTKTSQGNTQINKIKKLKRDGTGTEIKLSATQMRKQDQKGGLLSALIPMATSVAKQVIPHVAKVAAPLATGALSWITNWGVTKALGGSIVLPPRDWERIGKLEGQLTKDKINKIIKALEEVPGFNAKAIKQKGGLLGTVLASIGVPLLMSALTGKGISLGQSKQSGLSVMPPRTTPKTGSGQKKQGKKLQKGRKGSLAWEEQPSRTCLSWTSSSKFRIQTDEQLRYLWLGKTLGNKRLWRRVFTQQPSKEDWQNVWNSKRRRCSRPRNALGLLPKHGRHILRVLRSVWPFNGNRRKEIPLNKQEANSVLKWRDPR